MSFTDSVLGTFEGSYDFGGEWFACGEVPWCGKAIGGEVALAAGDEAQRDECLATLRKLCQNSEAIDARARAYACQQMLANANKWKQADEKADGNPITPEEFQRRLVMSGATVWPKGKGGVLLQYEPDGMFTDHGLNLYLNDSGEFCDCSL